MSEGKEKTVKATKYQEIKSNLVLMEKSLLNKENNQFTKICQNLRKQQQKLESVVLEKVMIEFSNNEETKQLIGGVCKEQTEINEKVELSKTQIQKIKESSEIQMYLDVLTLVHLVRLRQLDNKTEQLVDRLIQQLKTVNSRLLDSLNSTVYFYYQRIWELKKEMKKCRPTLMEAYRNSCVHNDEISQATILNLILRNYLHNNQIEQAQHLVSKTSFPQNQQNNQYLRYLYYTGLIRATQLEYNEAYSRLVQVLRKAPEKGSIGFKTKVQKLQIIVEMLMGDIPSKQIFTQSDCKDKLFPYYKLVQTVYKGRISDFNQVVCKYEKIFRKDKLMNLINRLAINVIKIGFRKINLSYSQISFNDIKDKLGLSDSDDMEFIIAKQIRDGVFQAVIDHQKQVVEIKEHRNVYDTEEPSNQFTKRINFCLNLYNQAIKQQQYPDFKKQDNKEVQQTEDELAQEIVKELEEEEAEDDFEEF